MLYTASDPSDAVGAALEVERSLFAPPPDLLHARRASRRSPHRFAHEYRAFLRLSYVRDRQDWIDLAEHAALDHVTLVGHPDLTSVLFDALVRVGAHRGLLLDPNEDDLGETILESRRLALLRQSGQPTDPSDAAILSQSTTPNRKSSR